MDRRVVTCIAHTHLFHPGVTRGEHHLSRLFLIFILSFRSSVRGAPVTSYCTILLLHTSFSFSFYTSSPISHVSLMTTTFKSVPLVAPGHTRPVTHLSFSPLQDDKTYLLISSCKDGNPMLREWTGDWVGTFIGHKGAVWSSKISRDTSKAVSGSADFTAYVSST